MSPHIPTNVRLLLSQLELLSHGSTASWNPAGGHTEPAALPFGENDPPHLRLRARYLAADSDEARTRAVNMMNKTLREFRGTGVDRSKVVGETREQEDARIVREGNGFTADEVALRFNCTPTRVRRVRLAAGRDDVGREPARPDATDVPAVEAVRMRSNGMTIRQIAFALSVPKSTINDWLHTAKLKNAA